jgi:hypothetical protein
MKKIVTEILFDQYGIHAKPGMKIKCPFCGHESFSVKSDNTVGKCFHPTCEKYIRADLEEGEGFKSSNKCATMQPVTGCTLEEYADLKNLPVQFLNKLGLEQIFYLGSPAVRIPYFNENRDIIATRYRININRTEEIDDRFRWKTRTKPALYGIWRIQEAIKKGYVVIVEGESDTQTLWFYDIPAVGVPGANSWQESWSDYFQNISLIYIFIEKDSGGEAVLKWISKSSIKDRVRLLRFDDCKDPSELHISDPENFNKRLTNAFENAVSFRDEEKEKQVKEKELAWEGCSVLALEKNILDKFVEKLKEIGVVGESRLAKLLYLALVSRFLDKPVSIAIKGPSSCGKSYMLEQVLRFFPTESYYMITAMSERALAYSEEPLAHRFLVICEAIGVQNDFISYLLRSLLSEGRLRYETVDKTKEGLKSRVIEREGPTGLIVTTTSISLHPENETRILSIPITDTKEQTRNIILSIADMQDFSIDLSEWCTLQEWLLRAKHNVIIPYARALAKHIPILHVRQRRDFTQLLNLIKAHAILHQASRDIDESGRIVADLDDYRFVRELLVEYLGEGIEATVSENVREVVKAVVELIEIHDLGITIKALSEKLNLDKSVISRRVKQAISHGYILNLEDRKYRPAKLTPGEALPEEMEILPEVELIRDCMVAEESKGIDTPPTPQYREENKHVLLCQDNNLENEYPWRAHLID